MRTIKTRKKVEGIKVLDKSANLSKRMKDAFVRTKEKAEETQKSRYDSPTEYAGDKVQSTAQGVAREIAHSPNPVRKARDNLDRAKEHFGEVKRQMPKERQRVAEQAQKMAVKTRDHSDKLHKTEKTASAAKTAVKDAKRSLKETRQAGRQELRDIKRQANVNPATDNPINSLSDVPKSSGDVRPGYLNKGVTASNRVGDAAKSPSMKFKPTPGGDVRPGYLNKGVTNSTRMGATAKSPNSGLRAT